VGHLGNFPRADNSLSSRQFRRARSLQSRSRPLQQDQDRRLCRPRLNWGVCTPLFWRNRLAPGCRQSSRRAGKLLIAGTGAESTAETIARTKRAAVLGYDVALVKTPYYYKPAYKTETYLRHYRAVADASPIPILLYSVPIFTGVTLETLKSLPPRRTREYHWHQRQLRRHSAHRGGRRASTKRLPDSDRLRRCASRCAGQWREGCHLALASALPEKCVELFELFQNGQQAAAQTLQQNLALASKAIVSEGGIAGVKYAMDLRGYHGGLPRLPLLPLADARQARIAQVISQFEPATARA